MTIGFYGVDNRVMNAKTIRLYRRWQSGLWGWQSGCTGDDNRVALAMTIGLCWRWQSGKRVQSVTQTSEEKHAWSFTRWRENYGPHEIEWHGKIWFASKTFRNEIHGIQFRHKMQTASALQTVAWVGKPVAIYTGKCKLRRKELTKDRQVMYSTYTRYIHIYIEVTTAF